MDLLYRAPLLLFDIKDPLEIKKHWLEILEAIRLSSVVFFEKIRNKEPEELSVREKKSLYRYLLRGKYRATPFGRWAGVGVACWVAPEKFQKLKIELETTLIPIKSKSESAGDYWLNPSLEPWGDGWKFWNFDLKNEQWRYSKADDSPIIPPLRNLAKGNHPIGKDQLFRSLPNLLHSEREKVWSHLKSQHILCGGAPSGQLIQKAKEDHFILGRPEVIDDYQAKLDTFFTEAANLAVLQENHFLARLTDRFAEEFDDRFVPLNMLWRLVPYLNSEPMEKNFSHPILPLYFSKNSKRRTLDLKEIPFVSNTKIKVNHTQALFRILDNGQILIDNLVFNRPFVYGGRFTHQPAIFDYFVSRSGTLEDVLYADVMLIESHKAMHINAHKSVTKFRINCFTGSGESNELDGTNTYIGIENGKFILIAEKTGKQVIPIFQHPLNPQYITHPLCRILWEIAHQNFLKPIYYSGHQFVEAEYLPQLQWGDIILQPRQWNIKPNLDIRDEEELIGYLSVEGVPNNILVGFQDQELALELSCQQDRVILLEEIRKNKPIHIQEWLWKSGYPNNAGTKFYPQFLWGSPSLDTLENPKSTLHVNFISENENKDWLSARIILSPDFQRTIIENQLCNFFEEIEQLSITPYYFLYYQLKNMEIRLRCRLDNQEQKNKVTSLLFEILKIGSDIDHIKIKPYYPEFEKYNKLFMPLSEEMFCQESKLISRLNLKTKEERISLAVGICGIYLSQEKDNDFWIEYLKNRTVKRISKQHSHHYIKTFLQLTPNEWQENFHTLISQHPWSRDPEKKENFIGNHLHMLINRIFWEEGVKMEETIFAVLYSYFKESRYLQNSSSVSRI